MWGNHIKSNLFQSTLAEAIDQLPPTHVEKFLRLVHSPQQRHISNVKQSMNLALVVVQQYLEDYQLLYRDLETLRRHLEEQERQLKVHRSTLEAIHHELGLPTSRSERAAA
ncbi:hypothetical protein P3T76_001548 [Phytophthora citrophthora]|uniref:Uncharacterized protein n=1 Tax=Phytophthora citrophthora TaxID=4793 RepID=A0AAD9H0J8_9STRA|nr:hypothetical protein P3T76_001548 [Phytophthora citrophthora]